MYSKLPNVCASLESKKKAPPSFSGRTAFSRFGRSTGADASASFDVGFEKNPRT